MITFHDRVYAEFEKQYYENPENFFEGDSLNYLAEGIRLDTWSDPIFKNVEEIVQ